MALKPLVTAGIETALNAFLWRDRALKPARQRLLGKVLRVELKEFSSPLVLVFSERQVDVRGGLGRRGRLYRCDACRRSAAAAQSSATDRAYP